MIYHWNIKQGTAEWHKIRELKLTASHATAIGNCGKGLETYCRDIVRKYIAPEKEVFINKDMERGTQLEPIARQKYEMEYDCIVNQVGFISYNDFVGISPDGLVGLDGLAEFKARNDKIHFGLLLGDEVDSDTIWQMNMQMLVSERKWCDFGSFNPNFKRSLFVKRFYPDDKRISSLMKGFGIGEGLIKKLLEEQNIKAEIEYLKSLK